jgi:adenosylcobinamide-phosphate synthase
MALLLGLQLAKPGVYALNAGARTPSALDTRHALKLASNTVLILAGLTPAAIIFITWILP